MQPCCWLAHPNTPAGTGPSPPSHLLSRRPIQQRPALRRTTAAHLGSSSYQSILKLCGNKLLNGQECLQLSLQSTIKFAKSFYSAVSLE